MKSEELIQALNCLKVQTGAFIKKENAEAYAEMLEAAGYPTIIKEEKHDTQ